MSIFLIYIFQRIESVKWMTSSAESRIPFPVATRDMPTHVCRRKNVATVTWTAGTAEMNGAVLDPESHVAWTSSGVLTANFVSNNRPNAITRTTAPITQMN